MSKTVLYYFSATGNSLAVARSLADVLGVGDPISVPGSLINKDPYIDAYGARALGFVFPVQRATIPEMLRGFIHKMPIDPTCYYFAVSTYSVFGCNEFWDIDELLDSKGAALNYAAGIRMMGNVGLMKPSETTIAQRLKHMESKVDEIATAVAYHQENFFPRSNKVLGWAIRTYTDLHRKRIVFRIDKRCKGCGICAQVCPAQNIHLSSESSKTPAPIRSDKCEACLACVHWCPAAAVSTSLRKHTSYHNPRVLPEQLHTTKLPANANSDALVTATTKEAAALPGTTGEGTPNKDLAAALQGDLLTPADVDNWLSRSRVASDQTHAGSQNLPSSASPQAHGMSDAEIVKALSDLESPSLREP